MTQIERRFPAPMPPAEADTVANFGRQTEPSAAADALRMANKRRLFDGLTAMGITHVTVTFRGCGAHGRIDGITAWSGETPVEFPDTEIAMAVLTRSYPRVEMCRLSLADGVALLAHDFLADLYADEENSVEPHGAFCFDAAAGTIHVESHVFDGGQARPTAAKQCLPPPRRPHSVKPDAIAAPTTASAQNRSSIRISPISRPPGKAHTPTSRSQDRRPSS